jgi:hypothetical protein
MERYIITYFHAGGYRRWPHTFETFDQAYQIARHFPARTWAIVRQWL